MKVNVPELKVTNYFGITSIKNLTFHVVYDFYIDASYLSKITYNF